MRTTVKCWSALTALLTLLPAPMPALAHQEGPAHPHKGESQPATKPPEYQAVMVRWTDDGGRVHYSQGLDSVPEKFRSRAVPLGQTAPSGEPGQK